MESIRNIRQKVADWETNPVVRYTEYAAMAVIIIIAVLYSLFQTVWYRNYIDFKVATDESYVVFDEKHNIYSNVEMSETLESLYKGYFEKQCQNLPLYNNDYAIIITDDVLTSTNPYTVKFYKEGYTITANTNALRKTIVLDKKYISSSFHHEIGHAVDNTYHFSKSEEFEVLYNNIEHDDYLTSSISEYFAESYARFLLGTMNKKTEKDLIKYFEKILDVAYLAT